MYIYIDIKKYITYTAYMSDQRKLELYRLYQPRRDFLTYQWRLTFTFSHEPCSKPFLDLNAISRPYACTLRNPYATTIAAYAEDYGQHNLMHCLRDPVSWRKMTPHCSASLRIPMAQSRYLDVFLLSGFLFESITQGFQYLIASTSRSYK